MRRGCGASLALLGVVALPIGAQKPTPTSPPATRSTMAGVYSVPQATRGEELYAGFCRQCHTAESHTGAVFRKWWSGRRLAELFSYVSTRMPKNEPGSLDPQHYADLVAYLLKMNAMPTGAQELAPDLTSLQQIRIVTPPAPAAKRKKS